MTTDPILLNYDEACRWAEAIRLPPGEAKFIVTHLKQIRPDEMAPGQNIIAARDLTPTTTKWLPKARTNGRYNLVP